MNQDFYDRYRLLDQVAAGAVRTHHALAATGAIVMVHLLDDAASAEGQEILTLLDRLGPAEKERVLEVREIDGTTAIVTRFLLEFQSLRGWLRDHAREGAAAPAPLTTAPPAASPPPDQVADEAPPPAEPGEFTRLFSIPAAPEAPTTAQEEAVSVEGPAAGAEMPNPVAPREGPDSVSVVEPGEFTRLFQSLATSPAEPTPGPEEAPALGLAPASVEPECPLEALPTDAVGAGEEVPAATGPGEFTRLFQSPAAPSTPRPAAPHGPLLGSAGSGGPWRPGRDARDSYLDRLHAVTPAPSASLPEVARPDAVTPPSVEPVLPGIGPISPAPPPSGPSGPSEFTRIVATPIVPAPPILPAPPLPISPPPVAAAAPVAVGKIPAGAGKTGGALPLLVGLGLVLLLTVALVLYFALAGG